MPILSGLLKLSIALGILTGSIYLAACIALYVWQTRMIFLPSAEIQTTPDVFNLPYEEVWAQGDHPQRLHGWWLPANSANAKVVLFLHGNALNIGANLAQADRFHKLGLSVLLMDYRGYGRSEGGFPFEQQFYEDAETMWNYLTQDRQIPPEQIILYGHSLGGAIAIELATRHANAGGLIVESSFTSMRQMVDRTTQLSLFPVGLLLTQQFNSIDKMTALQLPILLIHGTADTRTFPDMTQALYQAAAQPKQLYLVPTAGHNDVGAVGGAEYLRVLQEFLSRTQAIV